MSNVEARVARTLSPPGGDPFGLRGGARRGALAAKGIRRRRLFAAALFAGDIVSGTMAIVAAALIVARLAKSDVYRAPTAILGAGASSRALARLLLSHPACGLCPIGFIDDGACSDDVDEFEPRHGADDTGAALPVLGTLDGWRDDGSAEVVIVPDCEVLPRDPAALYRLGARQVLVINRLGEFPSFGLQVRNAGCFVALELSGQPRDPSEGLKRAMDLVLGLAVLLVAAPIIGLLALMIKLADPGPAFYCQWRIGRNGTPIRILKLRPMYRDA